MSAGSWRDRALFPRAPRSEVRGWSVYDPQPDFLKWSDSWLDMGTKRYKMSTGSWRVWQLTAAKTHIHSAWSESLVRAWYKKNINMAVVPATKGSLASFYDGLTADSSQDSYTSLLCDFCVAADTKCMRQDFQRTEFAYMTFGGEKCDRASLSLVSKQPNGISAIQPTRVRRRHAVCGRYAGGFQSAARSTKIGGRKSVLVSGQRGKGVSFLSSVVRRNIQFLMP